MATDINTIRLVDILPPSIKNDPQVQAAAIAIDSELQSTTMAIQQTILIPRINELPEDILDQLAWQFHVDFYEPGLAIEKKRVLVLKSIDWHRRKGTPSAVQEVVSAALDPSEVLEWFDYGGQPYHFKIRTKGVMADQNAYAQLRKAINTVKNTRSWLDGIQIQTDITVGLDGQKSLYFGFATNKGGRQTIGLSVPKQANNSIAIGITNRIGGMHRIKLSVPTLAIQTVNFGGVIRCGGRIFI